MGTVLENKWVKLGLSLSTLVYAGLMIALTYSTFLYSFVIKNVIAFSILYVFFNILFFAVMLLSREQIATSIVSMVMPPVVFLLLILNFGDWILFIPPFVVAAIMFFACKSNDTLKTILGTMYLLFYILGIIAFLLIKSMYVGSSSGTKLGADLPSGDEIWQSYSVEAVRKVTENNISPDGKYRYYLVDLKTANGGGNLSLYVEPNDMDKDYALFTFYERGRQRKIASTSERGDSALPEVKWVDADTIEYKFGKNNAKQNDIKEQKKDYFAFLD